jgi:hypothetical protein
MDLDNSSSLPRPPPITDQRRSSFVPLNEPGLSRVDSKEGDSFFKGTPGRAVSNEQSGKMSSDGGRVGLLGQGLNDLTNDDEQLEQPPFAVAANSIGRKTSSPPLEQRTSRSSEMASSRERERTGGPIQSTSGKEGLGMGPKREKSVPLPRPPRSLSRGSLNPRSLSSFPQSKPELHPFQSTIICLPYFQTPAPTFPTESTTGSIVRGDIEVIIKKRLTSIPRSWISPFVVPLQPRSPRRIIKLNGTIESFRRYENDDQRDRKELVGIQIRVPKWTQLTFKPNSSPRNPDG